MESMVAMETLVALCKRRGFIYQSSEIYGGLASAWDYGPMGVELKNRVQYFWWREMTQLHENIVGLDASILMHPRVWEASGHVENFTDPLVDCKKCKQRFRADQIPEQNMATHTCPECGGELTDPRQFNLMFNTHLGPVESDGSLVYLRPETAQGIYVNFKNVVQTARMRVPFGIAQVGKAFRNEITTKNFIFRTCEFEQMEMQFFIHPSEDDKWFAQWKQERFEFYKTMGIRESRMRFHQHGPDELAHYAKIAFDIEYEFPFGWKELEGIHNRTDYDLRRHMEYSKKDLTYLDDLRGGERYQEVARDLREDFTTFYDQGGAIGRRYRRQDEIGTPFGVTIDYQSKEDRTVTLRYRDSMEQVRVPIAELPERIRQAIKEYRRVD